MKGQDIIDYIVRGKMPDREQVRESCHSAAHCETQAEARHETHQDTPSYFAAGRSRMLKRVALIAALALLTAMTVYAASSPGFTRWINGKTEVVYDERNGLGVKANVTSAVISDSLREYIEANPKEPDAEQASVRYTIEDFASFAEAAEFFGIYISPNGILTEGSRAGMPVYAEFFVNVERAEDGLLPEDSIAYVDVFGYISSVYEVDSTAAVLLVSFTSDARSDRRSAMTLVYGGIDMSSFETYMSPVNGIEAQLCIYSDEQVYHTADGHDTRGCARFSLDSLIYDIRVLDTDAENAAAALKAIIDAFT